MYFSVVGQTRSASWSKGRIALLGDAAHCNATFGGAGTSMALLGAYILAGEAGAGGDIPGALHRYQQVMAPFVNAVPLVRPGALRLVNPRTRAGIRALHAAARMAAGPVGRAANAAVAAAGKLPIMHAAGEPPLPTYL